MNNAQALSDFLCGLALGLLFVRHPLAKGAAIAAVAIVGALQACIEGLL